MITKDFQWALSYESACNAHRVISDRQPIKKKNETSGIQIRNNLCKD